MNRLPVVCCVSLLGIVSLYAQQSPTDTLAVRQLEEVVVSDSRFELKREFSGKTIIRIGPEELAQYRGRSLPEILTAKSGIEISGSRGRPGEVLGVYARGGRGRQVLVLIDGVRVTDPSSSSQEYDLRLLAPDLIESIEIVKGASSTLYGTNAASAVINIRTRKSANRKFGLRAGTSLGTNQTKDNQDYTLSAFTNHAQLSGQFGSFSYSAGLTQAYSDHISSLDTPGGEEDPFSRYRADVRLTYAIRESFELGAFANQSHFRASYDESFGMQDADYLYTTLQKQAGAFAGWSHDKGELHVQGSINEFFSENISAFPGTFRGSSQALEGYSKYIFGERLHSLLGVSYVRDRAVFSEEGDFRLLDPYLNLVYLSTFGLNVNAGTRLNTHSEYGNQWVYNFNPSFIFPADDGYFKILGTLATSYITPSLTQLFGEFGANPDLEPETNRTLEGGIEWRKDARFRASLLYFNRKEKNYVLFDNVDFQYRNAVGTIDAGGVEAEMNWSLPVQLEFEANYTFTERQGDDAIRIPKHKVNATLGWAPSPRDYISLRYAFTGSRKDTDFETFETVGLSPFSLVHLYASREVIPGKLNIFLSAENLFNTSYTEILGYVTPGRNLRIGATLEL